jgi:hypothetical protein
MRSQLLKCCLTVMLVTATACGGVSVEEEAPASLLGEAAQAVLYPPPTPASGNILDSVADMGPVGIPGAVQAQFTTQPQYFGFRFQVFPGAQVKLEVTHLGSSMDLDTGLFVYGPRQADGSFGTTVLAQDDDASYGKLSKINFCS